MLLFQIFGIKVSVFYLGLILFGILAPMVWVRRLQVYAQFHLFADIVISFAIIVIIVFATQETTANHGFSDDIEPINNSTYLTFIGTSIFAFEGIGVILPVKDTCQDTKSYTSVVVLVLLVSSTLYVAFGAYNYFAYGMEKLSTAPLITKILPEDSLIVQISLSSYIFSSLVSYPMILHPANMVIESYLYKNMKSSVYRKYLKNLNRTLLVGFTIVLSLTLEDTLDKLMSVVGSVTCTPVSFILPALFHLNLIAESKCEKFLDYLIIVLGSFIMVFLTGYTFYNWNS